MGLGRKRLWGGLGCSLVATALGAALFGLAPAAFADVSLCAPGSGPGQCESPQGVAVNRESGRAYVADEGNNRVDAFDSGGVFQFSFSVERPLRIAIDNSGGPSKGDVYVGTFKFHVQKFGPGGEPIATFGAEGKGKCQFGRANDPIAVGPGGVVYVADSAPVGPDEAEGFINRIQEFSEAGACLKELVLFEGKRPLVGLAVDSSGDIYVTDDSATKIRKYDGSGGSLYTLDSSATELAVDGSDNLFAAEREGLFRNISEYDAAGNVLRRFGYGRIQHNLHGIAPFHSATGEVFGSEESVGVKYFALSSPGPVAVPGSLEAAPIGNSKATLNAEINPEGKETSYHFEYVSQEDFEAGGFSNPATKKTEVKPVGSDFKLHHVQAVIGCLNPVVEAPQGKCLKPSTVYCFRVIATNADNPSGGGDGTVVGPTFETKPPLEAESFATEVGVDTATLNAEVNPLGLPTTGYFQYVDDASFNESGFSEAHRVPAEGQIDFGSGEALLTRSATIFPLSPGASYHYRLIAEDPLVEPIAGKGHILTTFTPLPAGLDGPCANEALRTEAAAFLAECRAYEMVSPLDKNNGDLMSPTEGSTNRPAALNQSSLSGQRLTYSAYRAFGDAKSSPYATQYIAARDPGAGWATHAIVSPRGTPILDVGIELDTEFKAFSADLCNAWIRTVADPVLAPGAIARFPNLYRRQDDECGGPGYEALTTVAPTHETPQAPGPYPGRQYVGLELQGLSEDGAEAIFVVAENLTEDAPPQPAACINDLREADECVLRLYERSADGALHYPCILPNGVVSSSPCAAGWPNDDSGKMRLGRVDNAISADGSRVFWTSYSGTPGNGKIYVRENANQPRSEECADASKACTIAVSGKAEEESGTSASRYWGAAKDGSKAIFTTGEDLYEFDVNAKTTHLIAHEVAGVMGASEDASYIYFASREDLDLGGSATAGELNLYLYHGGNFSFVAALAEADLAGQIKSLSSPVSPEPRRHQARVSGDGLHAAFMSFAAPTGYDNKDAVNGKTAAEVYLYEASASGGAGRLICASCNPSGARPVGANVAGHGAEYWAAARIPVWENTLYAARALSPDGKHLYFTSSDALSPRDTNGRQDVYQWEEVGTGGCEAADPGFVPSSGGCLSLISTGKSAKDSEFVEASPSGDDVFFSTLSSLVPQDYGLVDIYDARVGGGFPPPPPEKAECEGEACQSPAAPPQAPTPSSSTFEGAGNVKAGRCAKGRHKVRSAGRSRCVKANKKQKQKHKQGRAQR